MTSVLPVKPDSTSGGLATLSSENAFGTSTATVGSSSVAASLATNYLVKGVKSEYPLEVVLRDYQLEGCLFLSPRRRAFIIAPAGSGKTVIGARALSWVRRAGLVKKATWIGNTREQIAQAEAAMDPETRAITRAVCAAGDPDTSDSDIVIFDEAHHLPAVTWLASASRAGDKILWGLSATPWHDDEERNVIVREVFKEFFTIERERVLASGHLVEGKVYMHDIDRPGEFDAEIDERTRIEVIRRMRAFRNIPRFEHERRARWQITQEFVQTNPVRNSTVADLANRCADSTLILIGSIEHGEFLATGIPGAFVCHSKLPKKARVKAIDDFRSGALKTLIATQLADEGLDVPRAACLILAAGGRSAGKLEQRAGRVLRPFAGKTGGVIHDFMDRGATFAHAQSRARMQVYEKLGYEPEIVRN